MNDCLVIMNPRDIPVTKAAINELSIAKLWLTGYTEEQLAAGIFSQALEDSGHDRFFVISDDIIVRQDALDAVRRASLEHMVTTGYSQRSHTDMTVNVTDGPLLDDKPTVGAYTFRQLRDVVSWPEPLVPTWFTGMSITGMTLEMWRRFPFGCFCDEGSPLGYASDFHLSRRLQDAGVPIVAVREAFAYHWRNEWQHTNHPDDDPVLVGQVIPGVYLVESQVAEAV